MGTVAPPSKRKRGQRGKDKKKRKVTHTAKGLFPNPPAHVVHPSIAHIKKRAFLVAYARLGNVSGAAHAAGINRRTHNEWLLADADYVEAFKDAEDAAGDYLEALAIFRARHGSDVLTIFLLKGSKPKKYRERYEHSGPDGGPMKTNFRLMWGTDEDEPEPGQS